MLEGVIRVGGTGTEAAIDGYTLAGKTGTANKVDPKTGDVLGVGVRRLVRRLRARQRPQAARHGHGRRAEGRDLRRQVAAPAFQRIAQFALPYLGIPPS